jgi:hypothetical protein
MNICAGMTILVRDDLGVIDEQKDPGYSWASAE